MPKKPKLILQHSDQSPLDYASESRDRASVEMVAHALETKQFDLAFQAVVLASDPSQPIYHEGLIRIFDPTRRIIPARNFIGQVEETEIGRQIDLAALNKALRTLTRVGGLVLSVNTSARSLVYPPWKDRALNFLRRHRKVGTRLVIEVSEVSVLQIPELARHAMAEMRELGVRFALDDFGAEASSFRHLRDFQFEFLKIDGQFIRGVHQSRSNQDLCEGLIGLAYHLGAHTIAENVETEEDMLWLQKAGIDALQGYYFGAPTLHPIWGGDESAQHANDSSKIVAAAQKIP